MSKISYLEVFGPTIQGEGMVIGRKTMFIRTYGCDYSCSWCDTKYTWDGTEKHNVKRATAEEMYQLLLDEAGDKSFDHVTISGGNPALQGKAMTEFIELCHEKDVQVGLETQGSIWKDWFLLVDDLTISPKPPSSRMETDYEKLDEIIKNLEMENVNYSIKIVVFDEHDKEYAKEVFKRYRDWTDCKFYLSVGNLEPYTDRVITFQLLHDLERLWNMIIDDSELNDVIGLPQLHTLVWGNKRGV